MGGPVSYFWKIVSFPMLFQRATYKVSATHTHRSNTIYSTYTYVYIFSPKGLSIVKSQNSQILCLERGEGGKYSHMYMVAFLFCAVKLQNIGSFSPVLWTGWCWPVLLVSLMQWNCCGPMGQSTTTMTVEDLLPFTGRWTEATPDSSSGSSKTVLTSI